MSFERCIILVVVLLNACSRYEAEQLALTQNVLKTTADYFHKFELANNRCVTSVEDATASLKAGPPLVDAWGSAIHLVVAENCAGVTLQSAGADSVLGTSDDVTNTYCSRCRRPGAG